MDVQLRRTKNSSVFVQTFMIQQLCKVILQPQRHFSKSQTWKLNINVKRLSIIIIIFISSWYKIVKSKLIKTKPLTDTTTIFQLPYRQTKIDKISYHFYCSRNYSLHLLDIHKFLYIKSLTRRNQIYKKEIYITKKLKIKN